MPSAKHSHTISPKFAVIGDPIAHSQSPALFQQFSRETKRDCHFETIQANCQQFSTAIDTFTQQGGCGLCVTAPLKKAAFQLATQHTPESIATQTCNALYHINGAWHGHNTDGLGLIADLHNHAITLTKQTLLIIGAGGATASIIPALQARQPACIDITNRTLANAQALCKQLGVGMAKHAPYDIIINATSAGHQQLSPLIQTHWIHDHTVAVDLNYGEAHSPFKQHCLQLGIAHCPDGYGMLQAVARAIFNWFWSMQSTAEAPTN